MSCTLPLHSLGGGVETHKMNHFQASSAEMLLILIVRPTVQCKNTNAMRTYVQRCDKEYTKQNTNESTF